MVFHSGNVRVVGADSEMTLSGDFVWHGGTFAGTCTMSIDRYITMTSSSDKVIKNAWQIINHARCLWDDGDGDLLIWLARCSDLRRTAAEDTGYPAFRGKMGHLGLSASFHLIERLGS